MRYNGQVGNTQKGEEIIIMTVRTEKMQVKGGKE
jgi:hypothetical protein